jgi:hypothetical protein
MGAIPNRQGWFFRAVFEDNAGRLIVDLAKVDGASPHASAARLLSSMANVQRF